MKKSLIALAALAAVGAASAQSSVTLYGVVDIGASSHTTTTRDGSGSIRSRGVTESNNASSRIGFRGTEDLGGGLKANFVIEQGISPTNPTLFATRLVANGHQVEGQAPFSANGAFSTSTNRQSFVGLTSSIGTFNIGRQYSIANELSSISGYNLGAENSVGASTHLAGQVPGSALIALVRVNSIQYISPTFGGGFVARAQYGSGDGRETVESTAALANGLTTFKQRTMGLGLKYANGPVSVAAAYTNLRSQSVNGVPGAPAGATTNAFGVVTPAGTAPLTGQVRTGNLFNIGGSYDFGVAKLAGTYNTGKTGGSATNANSSRVRAYQISAAAPFGAIVPFVSFGRAYVQPDNAARTLDVREYQLGARYNLSKRTQAYAIYGEARDDAAGNTGASTFYKDRKGSVGVTHSF